jgi:hypothetical protein
VEVGGGGGGGGGGTPASMKLEGCGRERKRDHTGQGYEALGFWVYRILKSLEKDPADSSRLGGVVLHPLPKLPLFLLFLYFLSRRKKNKLRN